MNVPNTVPICDRVKVSTSTVMLVNFSVASSDGSYYVPANSTIVKLTYNGDNRVLVIYSRTSASTMSVL